jgi:hypothetical protein
MSVTEVGGQTPGALQPAQPAAIPAQQHRHAQESADTSQLMWKVEPKSLIGPRHTPVQGGQAAEAAAAGLVRLWIIGAAHMTVPPTMALRLMSCRRDIPGLGFSSSPDMVLPLLGGRWQDDIRIGAERLYVDWVTSPTRREPHPGDERRGRA